MNRLLVALLLCLPMSACQTLGRSDGPHRDVSSAPHAFLLEGDFDNNEQVWSARESDAVNPVPHVVVSLESTARDDWMLWRVHLDSAPPVDVTWAMHRIAANVGVVTLLPHRALVAAPATGEAFDPQQWTPLDACALRGTATTSGIRVVANADSCTTIAPGIGAQAALLPLAIEREGEWLHLRLYADQARGAQARLDARKVQMFGGWAAINGSGPDAGADSKDWHMNRNLRIGNEGGRFALAWRDGKPSGYSLELERLTYRDGNVPVLKLSVVDDGSGRTLAYAWANPEATRIGINLGWVQVGLDRAVATRPGSP